MRSTLRPASQGVIALAFMLVQPLLIGGYLPGTVGSSRAARTSLGSRRAGRGGGDPRLEAFGITSPPDVIDALTFTSPTPFWACSYTSVN